MWVLGAVIVAFATVMVVEPTARKHGAARTARAASVAVVVLAGCSVALCAAMVIGGPS